MDTTLSTKMKESRARLVQQGSHFIQHTTEAGTTFVTRTKKAGSSFVSQTRKAGEALVEQTKGASLGLATGVKEEASVWVEHLRGQGLLPASTGPATNGSAKATENGAAKLPNPRAIERILLEQVEGALEDVSSRVQKRIAWLDTQAPQALPAEGTRPSSAPAAASNGKPPITGYDDLSAKDVVARLERMTDEKAAAVLAYESAHKKRATILRAAEQRLATAE